MCSYVVVNVCGHERLNRLRIIDDSSPALVDDESFYESVPPSFEDSC